MNSGRQLLQLGRSVVRQQTQGCHKSSKEYIQQGADVLRASATVNREGVLVAKSIMAAVMLWCVGRNGWIIYHTYPETEPFEDGKDWTWKTSK